MPISPSTPSHAWWRSVRHAIAWHRRGLSAVMAAICALALVSAARPPSPPLVPVVVTTHAVAAGAKLAPSDLRVAEFPASVVPDQAVTSVDAVAGFTLVVTLPKNSVVTTTSTIDTAHGIPAGQRLVPFRLHDSTVLGLLHVGDLVTLVATTDNGVVTLAKQVRVAALPQHDSGGVLSSNQDAGGMVLLSCDASTAEVLAAWSGSAQVGIAVG